MKNKIWNSLGSILWWLLWPLWWFYFKHGGIRSRVLVVCGDEVLLVQGWLGDKDYSLPGGGTKKGESVQAGAVRELSEETGIKVSESALVQSGSRMNKDKGFRYRVRFYTVTLNDKPATVLPKYEIINITWVPLHALQNFKLDSDAQHAIKRYQPREQASLL